MKTLVLMALLLAGCQSAPPGSYGVNAFGFGVTYSTPGWSAPVPVVKSEIVTAPTLMVPANSPAASSQIATSQTGSAVPIVVAPVAAPVLAVPK
jgi:hypothetical protein